MPVRDSAKITPEARAVAAAREQAEEAARAQAEAGEAEVRDGEVIVIGTSPTTGEVLVKDTSTGRTYWKPGTKEQIEQATREIEKLPDTPEAKLRRIKYEPPEGVSIEKPPVGQLTEESRKQLEKAEATAEAAVSTYEQALEKATIGKKDGIVQVRLKDMPKLTKLRQEAESAAGQVIPSTLKVYNYRGEPVELTAGQLQELSALEGQAQFRKMQQLGLIRKGAQFVADGKQWRYIPAHIVEATERFQREHIQLPDGKWVKIEDWNKLPPKYQSIGIRKGFDAMNRAIEADMAGVEAVRDALKPYKTREGYDLLAAIKDYEEGRGGVAPDKLKVLFDSSDVDRAVRQYDLERKTWSYKGRIITDQERQKIIKSWEAKRDKLIKEGKTFTDEWFALGEHPANVMTLSPKSGQRMIIKGATWLFPPVRAALPEVEIKDITPLEWGIGAANVALIAAPWITAPLKGVGALAVTRAGVPIAGATIARRAAIAGIQAATGGVYTYATVKNWPHMSTAEKALAVAIDSAILSSALLGAFRAGKLARAPRQTRFRFDFSKKVAKITESPKVKDAIDTIGEAIAKQDTKLLKAGAKRLELAAAEVPPQLGGGSKGLLATRARQLLKSPEDWIKLTEKPPKDPSLVDDGIDANKRFVETAEETLRQAKSTRRRAAIEKVLKEARRQLATKVKERPSIFDRVVWTRQYKQGEFLPARVEKAIQKVAKTTRQVKVIKRGRTKEIPLRDFAKYESYRQVAKRHGVAPGELIVAISNLPLANLKTIVTLHPELAPDLLAIPEVAADPQTVTAVKTAAITSLKEFTQVKPEDMLKEEEAPRIAPFPAVEPAPAAAPKPEPYPEPEPVGEPAQALGEITTLGVPRPPSPRPFGWVSEEDKSKVVAPAKPEAATIAWRQGMFWKVLRPPYDKLETVKRKPKGVIVATGARSAYKTAQQVGKGPIPRKVLIDMGIMDIVIERTGKRRAKMTVKKGLKTDISGEGKPTTGISVVR